MKTAMIATALTFAGHFALADGGANFPAMTGQLGNDSYLVDANKMTLYTFDMDEGGVSNCYDDCADAWPPLLADKDAKLPKNYSLTKRNDGSMQVRYKEKPLYLWVKDSKPGDMTGEGVMDVWHVARP